MSDNTLSLKGDRIAKVIARAGICSRRDAERKILEGKVSVDGKVIDSPALNVQPNQIIVVDGKALPDLQPPRLWRYHKARGFITSHKDPEGRPTVFDQLPDGTPRVISVGRLDFNTEGLLLLTNDGELARFLEKPENAMVRRYRVRVHGYVKEAELEALNEGPVIDGIQYGAVQAILDIQKGSNAWINISIKEGKNREVRKIMESLGYEVTRLIRTDYGPVQLGKLPRGEMEEIPRKSLAEWFGGKVPGISPSRSQGKEGFAKAKPRDKDSFKDREKDKDKDKGFSQKRRSDRARDWDLDSESNKKKDGKSFKPKGSRSGTKLSDKKPSGKPKNADRKRKV